MMNTTKWLTHSLMATIALLGGCTLAGEEDAASSQADLTGASGLTFSSTGDPHERTGDGFAFENQKKGTFTAIKSYSAIVKDGSPQELMLLKKQEPCAVGVTCNTRAAIYVAGTKIKLFADGTLFINGTSTRIDPSTTLALRKPDGTLSGAVLRRTDPSAGTMVLTVRSPVGDVITLSDYYGVGYMDISGSISSARSTERVRGSLGCFDVGSSQADDLCKRFTRSLDEIKVNGAETFYPLTSAGVDDFLEAWRTVQADCAMADLGVDLTGRCAW
jgi:hypothetical protein